MFNPIAILFSVINLPEPAIVDDDTAPFAPVDFVPEPPVMRTAPIVLGGVVTPKELLGVLVAYRLDRFSAWQIGNVRAYEDGRHGVSILFQPQDKDLLSKWRPVADIVYVWWE